MSRLAVSLLLAVIGVCSADKNLEATSGKRAKEISNGASIQLQSPKGPSVAEAGSSISQKKGGSSSTEAPYVDLNTLKDSNAGLEKAPLEEQLERIKRMEDDNTSEVFRRVEGTQYNTRQSLEVKEDKGKIKPGPLDSGVEKPVCLDVRSCGFMELSAGYGTGSYKMSLASGVPSSSYISGFSKGSFVGIFDDQKIRFSMNGFSGGLYGGWVYRVPQSWLAMGIKAGASLTNIKGRGAYPGLIAGSGSSQGIRGNLAITDNAHLDFAFHVGITAGPSYIYLLLGWSGHFLSGKIMDVARNLLMRLQTKMASCFLTGLGVRTNLSPNWGVGMVANFYEGGSAHFREAKGIALNPQTVGGITAKIRPLLIEFLGTVTYMIPTGK